MINFAVEELRMEACFMAEVEHQAAVHSDPTPPRLPVARVVVEGGQSVCLKFYVRLHGNLGKSFLPFDL